jgi:ferredoxin
MHRVDEASCTGCGDCVDACPAGAITLVGSRAHIDEASCTECGSCADACSQGAIVVEASPNRPASIAAGRWPAVGPASPVVEPARLIPYRSTEVAPILPRRSRVWPVVGSALVWAARELLPEVLAAWRASHAGALEPTDRPAATSGQLAPHQQPTGHRHRRGHTG